MTHLPLWAISTFTLLIALAAYPVRGETGDSEEAGLPAPRSDATTGEPDSRASTPESHEQPGDPLRPLPVYVPPPKGAAVGTVGGSTRGLSQVLLLAPDYGLTTSSQPVVWWMLAGSPSGRVRISVAADSEDPVLDVVVTEAVRSGFHPIALADHDVELGLDQTYSIRLTHESPSGAFRFAVARITRVEPNPKLTTALAASDSGLAYLEYAQNGIWYEALRSLSEQIDASPRDPGLRAARAALLDQIGLEAAASWDRGFQTR